MKILEVNVKKTKLDALCHIFRMDYSEYIRKNAGKKFDIVFIDPPYAADIITDVLKKLVAADMLNPGSVVVCESGSVGIFSGYGETGKEFEVLKQNKYGISYLTLLKKV